VWACGATTLARSRTLAVASDIDARGHWRTTLGTRPAPARSSRRRQRHPASIHRQGRGPAPRKLHARHRAAGDRRQQNTRHRATAPGLEHDRPTNRYTCGAVFPFLSSATKPGLSAPGSRLVRLLRQRNRAPRQVGSSQAQSDEWSQPTLRMADGTVGNG
jgi:hypothetical protein